MQVGVPIQAVRQRMLMDHVDPATIEALLADNGFLDDRSHHHANDKAPTTLADPNKPSIRLYWDKINDEADIAGSIWGDLKNDIIPDETEAYIHDLISHLRARENPLVSPKPKIHSNTLIGFVRSANIAVSLRAFSEFKPKELAQILGCIDCKDELQLDTHENRVQLLETLLPSKSERILFLQYRGPVNRLDTACHWLRMAVAIPNIDSKVRAIATMGTFYSEVRRLRENNQTICEACRQVIKSQKLRRVLSILLRIGNILNESTRLGNAAGFRLAKTLPKARRMLPGQEISYVDLTVQVFSKSSQESLSTLLDDLAAVQRASRMLLGDLDQDVHKLDEKVRLIGLLSSDLEREDLEASRWYDPSGSSLRLGIQRLVSFAQESQPYLQVLRQDMQRAHESCQELMHYCGESGGPEQASSLLAVIWQFAVDLEETSMH